MLRWQGQNLQSNKNFKTSKGSGIGEKKNCVSGNRGN